MPKANNNWLTPPASVSPNLPEKGLANGSRGSTAPHVRIKSRIPTVIRIWHLYLEPVAALGGFLQLAFAPHVYFEFMPEPAAYRPCSRLVCMQLASTYMFLFLVEAVVLRVARDDKNIWRAVLFALLVCDVGHAFASWSEMGTRAFWCPWLWSGLDTVTMVMTIGPLILRAAYLGRG